jgi:uncharacterized protein (DUF58 family)
MPHPKPVDAPLLSEQEVAQLVAAAPARQSAERRRPPVSGRSGEELSPRHGGGTEFAETRAYQPGDDPRRIDWRATARSRVPLVRIHHAEFARTSCIVIDRRAGMRFGSRVRLKATQAVRMALWLAGAEARRGGEFAAVLLDDPCHWLPPARGARALRRLVAQAVSPCPPRRPGPDEPSWDKILAGLRMRLPQGSGLTIISDFAGLGDDDFHLLRALGRHADCHAIRIVDPLESGALPYMPVHLCWGDRCRSLGPADQAGRAAVSQGLQAWDAFLAGEFRRAGFSYCTLASDADAPGDLLAAATP